MQTLTGMHRYIHAHTNTHTLRRAVIIGPSHSPNQFHSQASCQAAMLSKYYHNVCVSLNMQLMNGWHPVKLRDTETNKKKCPLTVTVLERLPYLPIFLNSDSFPRCVCDFLSHNLCFRSHFFLFIYFLNQRKKAWRVAQQRKKRGSALFNLWIWRFASSHGWLCRVEHLH